MRRLIDEDDVKNWLQKRADGYGHLYPSGCNRADELKIIKEELDIRVPTAYKPKRVMDQLKNLKPYKLDLADAMMDTLENGKYRHFICLEEALNIVKAGGIE